MAKDKKKPEALTAPGMGGPTKHAFRTGNRIKRDRHNPGAVGAESPLHAAADVLHGWSWHKHHYAAEVYLSETDYLAAVEAAGEFKTHGPAMAPHWADEVAKRDAARKKAKESKA